MNVEIFQGVSALVGRYNSDPISELLLLQELLGQILDVSLREGSMGLDLDDRSISGDGDLVTQLAGLAVDLDPLLQEGLLRGDSQYFFFSMWVGYSRQPQG